MENHTQSFDVCVVCALPEEARAFLEVMRPQCESTIEERSSLRYQYSYRFATIKNNKDEPLNLHVSWLPRYGPEEMTLHLSRVLEECQPHIAIMTGICAGDAQHVQLGDLVVAERTFTYDNGKFTLDKHGRSVHLHDIMTYQLPADILQFLGLFDDWKPLVARLKRPPYTSEQRKRGKIACHIKAMASGSAVRTDNPFEDVRAPVRGTVAIDMEGAAFGLVMNRYPLTRWLVVKGVCDYADRAKSDTYHDYAARASAVYALSFIRAYVTHEWLSRPDGHSPSSRAGPSRVWNVPYTRNPFFTGREDLLHHLRTQMRKEQHVAIGQPQTISGLGGIGKSQLAVEYAYVYRQDYQAVLWVDADSTEALNSSYNEIATLLNLRQKDDKGQKKIVQEVKAWLEQHGSWLLILDNLDEPETKLFPPNQGGKARLFSPFLPPAPNGHILITTRASDLSHLGLGHTLEVKAFSREQGALFLLHRSNLLPLDITLEQADANDRDLALKLTDELGGLPLALDQVGAYIAATGTNLIAYVQLYQQHQTKLLKQRRNREYPESVATTWNISFERVAAKNPAAAELLRFCAFLAPEAIPEELFVKGAQALAPILAPAASDPVFFDEVIAVLREYSLITRDQQTLELIVHRLVQAVLRDSISADIQKQYMERAIHAVAEAFSRPDFDDWRALPALDRLLPHAYTCITWIERASLLTPPAARLLFQIRYILDIRNEYRFEEVAPDFKDILTISEEKLGESWFEPVWMLSTVAELYLIQKRTEEAELLCKRLIVEIAEQKLKADFTHKMLILYTLASVYDNQGKHVKALQVHEHMVKHIDLRKEQISWKPILDSFSS